MAQRLLRPRRRRRSPVVLLCIASPLVLCLGWTGLWLFARREAALAMDGWIANEAGHGRQWTCPDRRIAGFPFDLRLTCSGPSFHGLLDREVADISVAALTASASLTQPKAIETSFTSPLTLVKADRDRPTVLTWSAMILRGRLLPDDRVRFELQGDDPSLDDQGETIKAAHVEIHTTPAPETRVQDHAYTVWFKLDQGLLPLLDNVTGDEAPVSIEEKGVLTAINPSTIEAWPVLVEAWRRAGGTMTLTSLVATKGEFRAEAQGTLGLDEAHRLTGHLQTALRGYEPLAARFGISPRALSMGSALSKLLSHGSVPAPDEVSAIKLPVSFADGRILIGPLAMPQRLAPLY